MKNKKQMLVSAVLMTMIMLVAAPVYALADEEVRADSEVSAQGKPSEISAEAEARAKSSAEISEDSGFERGQNNRERFAGRDDIREASERIGEEAGEDMKASSFAEVKSGNGWALSDEEGSFAKIMIVEKEFVDVDTQSENAISKGNLKIGSGPSYKLDIESKSNGSWNFSVEERGNSDAEGTLKLEEESSVGGFSVMSGTLELDSGQEYDMTFGFESNKLKGDGESEEERSLEVEIEGNVELSEEGRSKLDELRKSFNGSEGEIEIEIEAEKEEDEVSIESEIEGDLTEEQRSLVEDLKAEIESSLEESSEEEAEFELKVKSEYESGDSSESSSSEGRSNGKGRGLGQAIKNFFGFGR